MQFLSIYIREDHPIDGWWLGRRLTKKTVERYAPKQADYFIEKESISALDSCVPTYVDDMDDAVNKAYAAWPTRLYLIGLDGRVVYAGGMAPYNYKPVEFKSEIEKFIHNI